MLCRSCPGWSCNAVGGHAILLPESAFGGTVLVDFTGVPLGSVNGSTIDGITFGFTLGGVPSADAQVSDVGPVAADFPDLEGNSLGVLSLVFPAPQTILAYRWAIDSVPVVGRFTDLNQVELFDASDASLGAVSFDFSLLVGGFLGGFVGVGDDVPFTEARLTFPSTIPNQPGARFAVDNIRFGDTPLTTVPEPATIVLIGSGALVVAGRRRHRLHPAQHKAGCGAGAPVGAPQ